MDFLVHNWLYMLVLVLFVGMHLTGFGCGHRRRRSQRMASSDALGRSGTARRWHGTAGNPLPESARDRESI